MRSLVLLAAVSCSGSLTTDELPFAGVLSDPTVTTTLYAMAGDGRVFACGDNRGFVSSSCDTEIPALRNATSISNSQVFLYPVEVCGAIDNGSVFCQTCPATYACGPWTQRADLTGVVQVYRGCALFKDGTTTCWGDLSLPSFPAAIQHFRSGFAILSDGSLFSTTGSQVAGLANVIDATQTSSGVKTPSACAITSDTALYCWGANAFGQLGDGSTQDRTSPTLIGSGFVQVVQTPDNTADAAACALMTDASIKCWGKSVGALVPMPIGVTAKQLVVQPSTSQPLTADVLRNFYAVLLTGEVVELSLTTPLKLHAPKLP